MGKIGKIQHFLNNINYLPKWKNSTPLGKIHLFLNEINKLGQWKNSNA